MIFDRSTYTVILRAASPIAHHAETFGNTAIVMTEPIRQDDGRFEKVPIVTGDTMRHGLREAAAYAFLDAAGLLGDPCLTESALRLLFAGGQLDGMSGSTISITDYRHMVDLVPSLGLLGGCAGNRMQPGKIQVDRALLICEESLPILRDDPWTVEWMRRSGYVLGRQRAAKDLATRVRADPTLQPLPRSLLSADALRSGEQRMLANEAASASGDALAAHNSKSSMMPRSFEVVSSGSHFRWSLTATVRTPLERDTFDLMLAAWLSNMVVGGKKGTGHGRLIAVDGSRQVLIHPSARPAEPLATGSSVGALFREHVRGRATEIRDFLATVQA